MSLSLMNQLSTLGMIVTQVQNRGTVTVTAGDAGATPTTVFVGQVVNAWPNLSGSPDVSFDVEANGALTYATQTVPPTSFKGSSDVVTMMQKLAGQALPKLTFENNGVNIKLADQYLHGSLFSQIQQCANAARITAIIDNGVLAIMPYLKPRTSGTVPTISKDAGMIGYPSYTPQGIIVSTIFNPGIQMWGQVHVNSILKLSAETWSIVGIDHQLDSMLPQGEWKSVLQCFDSAHAPNIVLP